jgi:hypothetical protein
MSTIKVFLENVELEEGFIRGVGQDIAEEIKGFKDIGLLFTRNPDATCNKVISHLTNIRSYFQKNPIPNISKENHGYLKYRLKDSQWRMYFILNDSKFKEMIVQAKNGERIKGAIINLDLKRREVPELFLVKNNSDLLNILNKYAGRTKQIKQMYDSAKDENIKKRFKTILRLAVYGSAELAHFTKSLAAYAK